MEHVSSGSATRCRTAARGRCTSSAASVRPRCSSASRTRLPTLSSSLRSWTRSSKRTRMRRAAGGWERRRRRRRRRRAQGRRLRASRRTDRGHLVDDDATLHSKRSTNTDQAWTPSWRRRAELQEQRGVESQGAAFGLAEPVNVDLVKRVAKSHGATINDIVLAAIAEGIRTYINDVHADTPPPQDLTLTATVMVNPRPQKPSSATGSLNGTERLLADYAEMRGQGCDVTGAFVPLPCGDMPFSDRLQRVNAATRRMKLSGAPLLARSANNLALKCFGTSFVMRVLDPVFGKTSFFTSGAIFSKTAVKLWRAGRRCGAAAPFHYGASVQFHSYNGELRIVAVTTRRRRTQVNSPTSCDPPSSRRARATRSKSWVDTEIDRIRNAGEAV